MELQKELEFYEKMLNDLYKKHDSVSMGLETYIQDTPRSRERDSIGIKIRETRKLIKEVKEKIWETT